MLVRITRSRNPGMDMDSHILIRHYYCSISIISFLLLLCALPSSLSQPPPPDYDYSVCSNQPYECGRLPKLYYPFWGGGRPPFCGGGDQFELTCKYDNTSIQMGSQEFEVRDINTTAYTMKMVPRGEGPDVCNGEYKFALDPPFRYNQSVNITTLAYKCPSGFSPNNGSKLTCGDGVSDVVVYYYEGVKDEVLKQHPQLHNCGRIIEMPAEAIVVDKRHSGNPAFGKGFKVSYSVSEECLTCQTSNGACGRNDSTTHDEFSCYCPDGSNALHCHQSHSRWNLKAKIGVGVAAAMLLVLVVATIAFYYGQRRKKTRDEISYVQPRSMSTDPSSLKDTEIGSTNYGIHLFTYSELEEATNYFDPSKELGEGGFGTVYYGKLRDGRCVAVKRLYENNYKRVEQFKNEIQILTELHHKNLVSLYGCTSRHSRELLLVYEYIPNGTVADHLHGERANAGKLPWHIRMNIAVETASALAYLHASEVIHRDVKTNNILLDSHFVVKVADFGLSRLFPTDVTHVSTTPQGTPGYVDPEYHECYQLTVKSDVYSFGVVLVELISSLPAVDITRHRHEINLSNMAINKIHNQALHELVDPNLGFDSDYKVRKMINAVAELAFQCLQSSKDMRPSMGEVFDTLRDIQSDGKYKSQPEVMDMSTEDDVVLLKDDPPPPSPDSNVVSKSTTPNASG